MRKKAIPSRDQIRYVVGSFLNVGYRPEEIKFSLHDLDWFPPPNVSIVKGAIASGEYETEDIIGGYRITIDKKLVVRVEDLGLGSILCGDEKAPDEVEFYYRTSGKKVGLVTKGGIIPFPYGSMKIASEQYNKVAEGMILHEGDIIGLRGAFRRVHPSARTFYNGQKAAVSMDDEQQWISEERVYAGMEFQSILLLYNGKIQKGVSMRVIQRLLKQKPKKQQAAFLKEAKKIMSDYEGLSIQGEAAVIQEAKKVTKNFQKFIKDHENQIIEEAYLSILRNDTEKRKKMDEYKNKSIDEMKSAIQSYADTAETETRGKVEFMFGDDDAQFIANRAAFWGATQITPDGTFTVEVPLQEDGTAPRPIINAVIRVYTGVGKGPIILPC